MRRYHIAGCENDRDTSQTFANYFDRKVKRICKELDDNASHLPIDASERPCCSANIKLSSLKPATTTEIKQTVLKANNTSCDLDIWPTSFMKKFIDILSAPISLIINQSLKTGIVPQSFKTAIVIPTLKEPNLDPSCPSSYRPISNLSFLSKILEKIVYSRIESHLSANNLLSPSQSAYRKHHSTETSLLKVTNDILLSLDEGKSVLLVTLDVSAAFDTVNHSMLLRRYEREFGITGTTLNWMTSYLDNRVQAVQIGTSTSTPYSSENGFPQGSVLGGPKFSIHTTPLDSLVRGHGVEDQCYADDSNLYITLDMENTIESHEQLRKIENCLSDVSDWMLRNRLKVNAGKTKSILFSPRTRMPFADTTIKFDGSEIIASDKLKSLGVFIDKNMTLEKQVNYTVSSAWLQLRKISKVRNQLSCKVAETLVNTLVTSRLDYCNSLLCCLPAKLLKKLQKVQNASAKTVLLARKRSHVTPLLKRLHWLPIDLRCKYKVL